MKRSLALLFALCTMAVATPADEPMYPAPGMNTCTASLIAYNFAAYNLDVCRSTPGQNCYYETVAYTYARNQAMYWCFGTQL
ncbi:MAG: hypothetical protein OEX18_09445 [Candidatus Krumholzibacteria bacterium]|nr:hypothetical protein [Candidatus Krumholzibacteria bacterium]MDH5268296.1 hypothetical protein [Candidatus Krumholzibacteria bacterium]